MVSTARRARTDWAATRIAAFIGLVFRMLWSVAAGLIFLVFLVTPLPLLRKATHFFLETTADSAACRVLALPEMWFHIARRSGLVGAWRLTGVCRAARAGAKEWLQKLPRLVVCGGLTDHGGNKITGEVWRLNLGDLRWERLPDLVTGGYHHACCAVRGGVVVLGGTVAGQDVTKISGERSARVEILGRDSSGAEGNHFKILPQLSCGPIIQSAVVVIDEIESDQGQVLLIGGHVIATPENVGVQGLPGEMVLLQVFSSAVWKVDLATGACTAQPPLLCPQGHKISDATAGRLPDGRVVCVVTTYPIPWPAEGSMYHKMAQVLEPPQHESPVGASWQGRALPGTSEGRICSGGCVLSDGRFAVFGGSNIRDQISSSCEALTLRTDGGAHWDELPPMHCRMDFVCAAIGGCVIVAGDVYPNAEVYEEGLGLWRQIPCRLPHASEHENLVNNYLYFSIGSAVM
jgi:hypothetical protein